MDPPLPLSAVHVPTGAPPADVESSSVEVRAVFLAFGAPDVPDDLEFVQRGEGLGRCLRASRTTPTGRLGSNLRVTEILFLSETTAIVRLTVELRSPHAPRDVTLFTLEGRAVREKGVWLMERATFCDFIGRTGIRCPAL